MTRRAGCEVVCYTDHRPEGTSPGHVVAWFPSEQEARDRGLEESYPRCTLDYRDALTPEPQRGNAGQADG